MSSCLWRRKNILESNIDTRPQLLYLLISYSISMCCLYFPDYCNNEGYILICYLTGHLYNLMKKIFLILQRWDKLQVDLIKKLCAVFIKSSLDDCNSWTPVWYALLRILISFIVIICHNNLFQKKDYTYSFYFATVNLRFSNYIHYFYNIH